MTGTRLLPRRIAILSCHGKNMVTQIVPVKITDVGYGRWNQPTTEDALSVRLAINTLGCLVYYRYSSTRTWPQSRHLICRDCSMLPFGKHIIMRMLRQSWADLLASFVICLLCKALSKLAFTKAAS